jgi:hypothetical protein
LCTHCVYTPADWHYALTPAYNNTLEVQAGGSDAEAAAAAAAAPEEQQQQQQIQLQRRERPQLLMGKDGLPKVLFNGVMSPEGEVFTFAQTLGA